MSPTRTRLGVTALVLILLGLAGYWVWAQVRPYEPGDVADIEWTNGGRPGAATVTVIGPAGLPLAGVKVRVNQYPADGSVRTGADGVATVEPGDEEVWKIELNQTPVVERPMAGLFGRPSARDGLLVTVKVKDLAAVKAPPGDPELDSDEGDETPPEP